MRLFFILFACFLLLFLLFVLALRGRKNFACWEQFDTVYAHRGLFDGKRIPENSLAAFRKAREQNLGVEFDLRLTADGELAVLHDESLLRTAGVDRLIGQVHSRDLKNCFLGDTGENIPTLRQVLEVLDSEIPAVIELKSVPDSYKELCTEAARQLRDYKGVYCIESFDPRVLKWFRKNSPDTVRGQLSERHLKNGRDHFFLRLMMGNLLLNFLTRPDFIAYSFSQRKHPAPLLAAKVWKLKMFGWTIRGKNELETAKKEHIIPICEHPAI